MAYCLYIHVAWCNNVHFCSNLFALTAKKFVIFTKWKNIVLVNKSEKNKNRGSVPAFLKTKDSLYDQSSIKISELIAIFAKFAWGGPVPPQVVQIRNCNQVSLIRCVAFNYCINVKLLFKCQKDDWFGFQSWNIVCRLEVVICCEDKTVIHSKTKVMFPVNSGQRNGC